MASDQFLMTIGEVSAITGVNSVTLRAWQRRYGLLKPLRTEKGHRLYRQEDIERIEAILSWLDKGVAVSKVKELLERNPIACEGVGKLPEWDALKEMVLSLDADGLEKKLLELTKNYPIKVLDKTLILPMTEWLKEQSSYVFRLCLQFWCSVLKNVLVRCLHLNQRAKGKMPCWMVSLHGDVDARFYTSALELQADGYNVTFLVGVDASLPNLVKSLEDKGVVKLVIYSDLALSAQVKRDVEALPTLANLNISIQGAVCAIHPELVDSQSDA